MTHPALAFVGTPTDGPAYPTLLVALEYHPGRWSESAIAAAAAIPDAGHLTAQDWTSVLDELDEALAGILGAYRPSRMRLRTASADAN